MLKKKIFQEIISEDNDERCMKVQEALEYVKDHISSKIKEDWENSQIAHAKRRFRDFLPDFKDYKDIQTLNWKHWDGSSNYNIRYIFDIKQRYMHISGDFGTASFLLSWEPTFKNTYNLISDPSYFIKKMECSTDNYVYPQQLVKFEVETYYNDFKPNKEEYDYDCQSEYEQDYMDFIEVIESFILAHDYHKGFVARDCEYLQDLEEMDPDYYKHEFGKCISPRVYYWLVGLEMAYEKCVELGIL